MPTIAAVSVLGACYSQLAIVLSIRRQNGMLKRVRATPLPAWTYFLGLLAHCIVVSVVDIALIVGMGHLFGVPLPDPLGGDRGHAGAGRGQFLRAGCRRGLADPQRRGRPRRGAARPVPPGVHLRDLPPDPFGDAEPRLRWLPVRPFNEALLGAFAQHSGADWKDLGVFLAWGAAGAVIAIWRFRWDPRAG